MAYSEMGSRDFGYYAVCTPYSPPSGCGETDGSEKITGRAFPALCVGLGLLERADGLSTGTNTQSHPASEVCSGVRVSVRVSKSVRGRLCLACSVYQYMLQAVAEMQSLPPSPGRYTTPCPALRASETWEFPSPFVFVFVPCMFALHDARMVW